MKKKVRTISYGTENVKMPLSKKNAKIKGECSKKSIKVK